MSAWDCWHEIAVCKLLHVLVWGVQCHAQVPMYSASGLRVQYLKVWEKSNYKVEKWVRKVCKSGDLHRYGPEQGSLCSMAQSAEQLPGTGLNLMHCSACLSTLEARLS